MADRLFVGVLGHRHSGKSWTWNSLFGKRVRTSNRPRTLELRRNECVQVFLISGSNEERRRYAGDVLRNQDARIILCSMQYVDRVSATIDYALEMDFWMNIQWLNPGYKDKSWYPDHLSICNRLFFNGATLTMRNGKINANRRVKEIRELIYGWAAVRGLIAAC
jgi:hypothetical protein